MDFRQALRLCRAMARCLCIGVLLWIGGAISAQQVVRVGVYNFAPVVSIGPEQKVSGLFVDAIEWVAQKEGWTLDYVRGSWQECLDRLENGEIDVLMSIVSSEERRKKFDFTQQHLFLDWGLVYQYKGGSISTVLDLQGKTIAALQGSIYTTELRRMLEQFEIQAKIIEKKEYADVFKAIANREVDAGINGYISGISTESAYPIERTTIVFSPLKLRFAVKKGIHGELLATMDRHFHALYIDKTSVYHEWHRRWTGLSTKADPLPIWVFGLAAMLISAIALMFGISLWLKQKVRRKTAELRRTKSYYQKILAESPIGIVTYDASGRCQTVNEQANQVLGLTAEQMLRQDFQQMESWKQSGLLQMLGSGLSTGQTVHRECLYPSPAGGEIWLDVICCRFSADGSNYLVQLLTDITEKKQARDRLKQLSLELKQLNDALEMRVRERTEQLEVSNALLRSSAEELQRSNLELEQFAYVASHDLQEPLRMVVGFIQLLEKRLAGKVDAEAAEFMGFAVDGALRMQKLIEGILTYSRVSSRELSLQPVDSADALQEAQILLGSLMAQSGARLKTASALPRVQADRVQLVQLFQNLLGNAVKFSEQESPEVSIDAQRDGSYWRFTVSDNGIGIDPKYRERIFGIFQRLHTRQEYEGTGIGLSVCRRIVQRHGGEIGVESAAGGGSTFWFTLREEEVL